MTLNALGLVATEDAASAYQWYVTEPHIMYPPSLQDLVDRGEISRDDALLAVIPRDAVPDQDVSRRAAALETARVHFLKTLIEQIGPGVGLHITKDLQWRL